jgi:ATP-binding cassette subfamily B multidrug efflux pump
MSTGEAARRREPPLIKIGPGRPRMPGMSEGGAHDAKGALMRLWRYLRRQRWTLVAAIGLVVASTLLNLAGPYLLGVAIDDYILAGDRDGLARIAGIMIAVFLVLTLTIWGQSILMVKVAQHTVRDLRQDVFDKLQTLSLHYFDQHSHGDLMSRLTNDVENVNAVLSENITSFLSSLLTLVGVVVMMLALDVPLALLSLIVLPGTAALTRYIARNTRRGFREQQDALGELDGLVEETISGGKTVRAYGRETIVIEEFERANRRLQAASIQAQTYAGLLGPGGNMINNIGFAIVAGAGGWLAIEGVATVGIIASFLTYAQQLRRPINEVSSLFSTIQSALAGAERVFTVLDEVPELNDAPDAQPLKTVTGRVVFEDVSFGYVPDVPVLKHVSLEALPGQTIALVGPTGAGKTTIINVLSRFYDVDAGRITIDSVDIRDLKRSDLRRQLGIVLQDTYLFSETVMENIRYGRLDATDEEVFAAARMANADPFIRHLPHGYQTVLSERAGNLSQGQRQMLAIARAILADPGILILDEATSSIDTRTEVQIQEAMLRLMSGRTSFVIAHRLSTIRNADMILVIREGEIIERGSHQGLLEQAGFYHYLYTSQFKDTDDLLLASST